MRGWKFVLLICAMFALADSIGYAKPSGGGSSRPSGGSSRPSGGSSRPSGGMSRPSRPSTPAPSKPSGSSGSKYSSGSKPSSPPASKPSGSAPKSIIVPTSPVKPSSSNIASPKSNSSKPSGTGYVKPDSTAGSSKPNSAPVSAKARENMKAASADKYAETKKPIPPKYVETPKATAPPKPTYTTATGKTVNVDTSSTAVNTIRSKPSVNYTPERRVERYETHIHHYHYSRPYSWYANQPYIDVGGGYSNAFFWIMMTEWSAQRRAEWLYHNEGRIQRDAYERGMRDATTAAEVAKLKAQNAAVNTNYIDPEFKDNPDLMYDQGYVEAAYNPSTSSGAWTIFLWVIVGLTVAGALTWFVFIKRW